MYRPFCYRRFSILCVLVLLFLCVLSSFPPTESHRPRGRSSVIVSVDVNVDGEDDDVSDDSNVSSLYSVDDASSDHTVKKKKPSLGKQILSTGIDVLPLVGTVKSGIELISGHDSITGAKIPRWESAVGVGLGLLPGATLVGKIGEKSAEVIAEKTGIVGGKAILKHIPTVFKDGMPYVVRDAPRILKASTKEAITDHTKDVAEAIAKPATALLRTATSVLSSSQLVQQAGAAAIVVGSDQWNRLNGKGGDYE